MLNFGVSAQSESATKTIVKARNFEIVIDEPQDLGGSDQGANPVEYVLAALCGCLNVVGHLVAKEMNINLKGISFEVNGDLDPSKFTGKETEGRAGFCGIHVTMKPDADADSSTIETWKKSVEQRCPVSDNISNITPVEIVLG